MKRITYSAGVLLLSLQACAFAQEAYLARSYDEVRINAARSQGAVLEIIGHRSALMTLNR